MLYDNQHKGDCIMNEIEKIKQLVIDYPKHFSQKIKRDKDLSEFLNLKEHNASSISEIVYNALYPETPTTCLYGKQKKFVSVAAGYRYCGKANSCRCVKESVARTVSKAKNQYSDNVKQEIQRKRKKTNLRKYGVENVGQSKQARARHAEFYQSTNNIDIATSKYKKTMRTRHGVNNSAELTFVKNKKIKTNLERYGVSNPMQDGDICKRSVAKRKETFDPISDIERRYTKFKKMIKNEFGVTVSISPHEYVGVAARPELEFICLTCNHTFIKRFDYGAPPICKNCYPTVTSYQSKEEIEVYEYVKSLLPDRIIIQRDRSIINPYELDILLPELKIAIEYCGLYWHSEVSGNKSWDYHYTKHNLAENKGYRLITIFSDEWNTKRDITRSKLAAILGCAGNKVFARKCTIQEIDRKEAIEFYNLHHIQGGPRKVGRSLGLFYDNKLIAAGSFVKKTNNECELVRYASSVRAVGGLSKILKHQQRTSSFDSVISFSDNRWGSGNVYMSCRFKEVGAVPPMQAYVKNENRYHKLLFPKKRINPNNHPLTEWQVMKNSGYDRIWDCGKIKWKLDFTS